MSLKKLVRCGLLFCALIANHYSFSQVFPNPAQLSTGQGAFGTMDPNWQVSQQCVLAVVSSTDVSLTYSPAVIQNNYDPAWINPATLPAPVNNGNWIGRTATSYLDDNGGCYRYYRLTLNLPSNCNGQSVTVAGNYNLVFDGYVDNTISDVYVNGVSMGIAAGGSYSAGTQLTFTLSGPWLVGTNYVDVLVLNGAGGSPNPTGLLLVASPSSGSTDSDGDGVPNINDACPCVYGNSPNGCAGAPPNNCNLVNIRNAFLTAGCTELNSCYNGCSLFFYYPNSTSSANAETFANGLGGHLATITTATDNACISASQNALNGSDEAWIGYTDVINEGTFLWLNGSSSAYTNWAGSQPNNGFLTSEDCSIMESNGQWNDKVCSQNYPAIIEVGLCPQATISNPSPTICPGSNTTLFANTTLGSGPYSYTWSPATGLSSTTGASVIATPTITTTYTLQSVDRYGCVAYAYTTITASNCPTPNNCNTTAIRTAFNAAGCTELTSCYNGCSLYFYYPTSGSSVAAETFAQTLGAHVVSIQSGLENACLAAELNSHGFGGIIWLGYTDVVSEGSFQWLDGSANGYTNWEAGEPNDAGPGEDCVQMFPNGKWNDFPCAAGAASILEVGLCPQATATVSNNQICLGSSTTLSVTTILGSAPYSYTWSPAIGLSSTNGSTVTATPTITTTYTVMSVDRYGCTGYAYQTVTVSPSSTLTVNSPTICLGQQTATLTVSGASTYTWSAGLSSTTGSVVTGTPITNTTYTVNGTDINGCTNTQTTTITVNTSPTITATSGTICTGQQSATLTANGATTYSWSPSAGLSTTSGSVVIANPTVNTTYSVGGIDANGCANFTTTTVTLRTLPTVTATASSSICLGQQTATLSAGGALNYSWTPSTNLNTTIGSVVTATPSSNRTYTVTGTDANGCSNFTTSVVFIKSLPIISVNNPTICIGQQTATLIANGGTSYTWSPATNLSSTSGSTVTANPNATKIYTVSGLDATSGCKNYTTTTVMVKPLPIITANSSSICLGQQTATLTASGAFTYSWFPSSSLSSFGGTTVTGTPTVTTTYTIVAVDVFGCLDSGTTSIVVYPIPVPSLSINSNTICIGNSITITAIGANSYTLLPGSLVSSSNYTLSPTTNTTYSVIATSTNNCYSTNNPTVAVTVYTLPAIMAQSDATINIGQSAVINASGGVSYSWDPIDGLTCPSCAKTKASPYVTTTYVVSGYDSLGCRNTDTIVVTVNYICADFFIPNVFSPNGDGLNDNVNIHGACIATYRLQIFDRWGEMVFESTDASNSWNGTYKGKALDTGVFMFKANGITRNGSPFDVKGNITLIR